MGKALLSPSDEDVEKENIVGVNVATNLFSDRLILQVRSDFDLSESDNIKSNQQTQVQLVYKLLDSLSLNLDNTWDDETKGEQPSMALKYKIKY